MPTTVSLLIHSLFSRSKRIIITILLLSFCHFTSAETEEEYQRRLRALTETIKTLQTELAEARASKDKLQQSLQTSEENIATYSKKVTEIKEALAREKKQLNQLQTQHAELVQQKDEQQQAIVEIIQHQYQLGQQSQLKLLLNQEKPQEISRLLQYHEYVVNAHQQKIISYSHTINELKQLETQVSKAKKQLEQRYSSLAKRQKTLTQEQQKRQKTLTSLNHSLNRKGKKLSALKDDQQRLQDLLDEANNSLANLPDGAEAFAKAKGKLPLPTQGKIVHRFGSTQFDGQLKRNGIFIRNKAGAKVISVHHGRVIFSSYFGSHGLLLIVDHGSGYMSLYGHNQTLLKETGDWVRPGEVIGTIGNSGGQTQVGLYFEIRHQGKPQNPQHWLQ